MFLGKSFKTNERKSSEKKKNECEIVKKINSYLNSSCKIKNNKIIEKKELVNHKKRKFFKCSLSTDYVNIEKDIFGKVFWHTKRNSQ